MIQISIKTDLESDYITKTVSSDVEIIPAIWFRFPKSIKDDLTERLDPFVYALIFPMMCQGGTFKFIGNVSKSVIENMEMFSKIWAIFRPDKYKEVKIIANEIDDDFRPKNNKMIAAFSGGLDASYVTYKYKEKIDKCVMILGADIPLGEKEQFELAFVNSKKMTDDLGIQLIPVETNYREYPANWEDCYGSVVAATLSFFSKSYFYGISASGSFGIFSIREPLGTNPITDKYFSSDTFRYTVDGYEHSRTQRANFIKNWKAGVDNLRVCWRNPDKSKNCGYCEKCVRTKLNFLAVGVTHLSSMPHDFTKNDLLNKKLIQTKHNINGFKEIYHYAKENNSLSQDILTFLSKKIILWERKTDKRLVYTVKYLLYKCIFYITTSTVKEKYYKKYKKYEKIIR